MASTAINQGIKDSRLPGINVPDTGANTFDISGVANVFKGAVETIVGVKDMQNQEGIEKRIRAEAELGADIVTNGQYSAQTDINAPANSQSAPKDLETSLKRLDVLKAAYGQGKVNETGYWARLNAVAKELRVKYPQYDEVIDSKFSKITGQVPGNALRNQLINDMESKARSGDAAQRAWDADLDRMGKDAVLPPNWEQLNQTEEGRAKIKRYAFGEYRARAEVAQRRDAIALNKEEGAYNEDVKYTNASLVLEQTFNRLAHAALYQAGGSDGIDGVVSMITKAKEDNVVSPEETAMITAQMAKIRGSISAALDKELHLQPDSNGRTLASYFKDSKRINDLKSVQMSRLDGMEKMVTDEKIGLLAWNKAYLEALQTGEVVRLTTDKDVGGFLTSLNALNRIGGQTVVDSVLLANLPKLKQLSDVANSGKAAVTTVTAPDGSAPPAKTLTGASPKAVEATVKMIKDTLTHPETTPEMMTNIINNAFGKGQTDFLGSFNIKDQTKVFKMLTAPDTIKKVVELSKTNPDAFTKYKDWFQRSTNTLLSQAIIDLQNLRGSEALKFDGKQVSIMASQSMSHRGDPTKPQRPVAEFQRQNVADINAALQSWRTFIEASGGNADEEVKKLLTETLRIDPNKPREKNGFEQLMEGFQEWIMQDKETLGKPVGRLSNRP